MKNVATLADLLIEAQNNTAIALPAEAFSHLSLAEAEEVQNRVWQGLGHAAPAAKVGLNDQAGALAAPIYEPIYKASGQSLALPQRGTVGIEVEVAVLLNRDLTAALADADDSELLSAIDRFELVIEPIVTRYDDRKAAGLWGGLADNLVTGGLVHASETPWPRKHQVDGIALSITLDGKPVYAQPSRHPFGDVLTPLRAYARVNRPGAFPIRAGTLVTTGSLCSHIVPITAPGRVEARLGEHVVVVDFT